MLSYNRTEEMLKNVREMFIFFSFSFKRSNLTKIFDGIEDFLAKRMKMRTLFQSSFQKIQDLTGNNLIELKPFLNQFRLYYFPV